MGRSKRAREESSLVSRLAPVPRTQRKNGGTGKRKETAGDLATLGRHHSSINLLRSLNHRAPIIQKRVHGIDNRPWLIIKINLNCISATIFLGKREKQTTRRTGQIIGVSEVALQETLKRLRRTIRGELSVRVVAIIGLFGKR